MTRRPTDLLPDYKIVLIYAGVKTRRKILDLIPERPDVVLVAPQYPLILELARFAAPKRTIRAQVCQNREQSNPR